MAKPATDSDDLSMEDILSSIRKIVSNDDEDDDNTSDIFASDDDTNDEEDLFGEASDSEEEPVEAEAVDNQAQPLMSRENSMMSSAAFSLLHQKIEMGDSDGTLTDIVKELLRPMLQSWLDNNLPTLVERLVQQEIARIAGTGIDANSRQE